jgi:dTMP kinase
MLRPRFITLEGGEGAGKSTQVKLLAQALANAGVACITTREPGGSKGAEAIRGLVVSGATDQWNPTTEALLFMAARYDHLETVITPARASPTRGGRSSNKVTSGATLAKSCR